MVDEDDVGRGWGGVVYNASSAESLSAELVADNCADCVRKIKKR